MLCYLKKGWALEQHLNCYFQNCDYCFNIVTFLLFYPFSTHCFAHMYCSPCKHLLQLRARSESRGVEPHHNLHLLIFSVVWSAYLLACFRLKPEVFLDSIPFLKIHIKLVILPASGNNRLCYKSHLPLKKIRFNLYSFEWMLRDLFPFSTAQKEKKNGKQIIKHLGMITIFWFSIGSILLAMCVWFWHSSPWRPYFRLPEIKFHNRFQRFLVEWKFRGPFVKIIIPELHYHFEQSLLS